MVEHIPTPIDYSDTLSALSKKLEEQSAIIQSQEERMIKLDEKLTTILELSAKNDLNELSSKINSIDAQMEKLNKSIEKLTAYVNED